MTESKNVSVTLISRLEGSSSFARPRTRRARADPETVDKGYLQNRERKAKLVLMIEIADEKRAAAV